MPEKKTVFVVVYHENYDGYVALDVFDTKKKAVNQMERAYAEAKTYLKHGQKIISTDYDHDGLIYFSVGVSDAEQICECFLREKTIQ